MNVETAVNKLAESKSGPHDLSEEKLRGLLDLNPDGPYHFVNLLKFKAVATYPDDHPLAAQQMSGQDAYNVYGAVALQQVIKRGGRLMQMNKALYQMGDEGRDAVATMEYQHLGAFLEMLLDPDYQAALVHRQAGLEKTDLIITRPKILGPVVAVG